MTDSGFSIECILRCDNHLGEGPVWDTREQALYWVDGTGRRVGKPSIWRYDPADGAVRTWSLDHDVGALALRQNGGAVLALDDGFYTFDFDTGALDCIERIDPDQPRSRLNDGKCDRRGRFLAGAMDDLEADRLCALWSLDTDMTVRRLADGIICTNGPCWSPDDRTFYLADTFQEEIWAYDYDIDTGELANRRLFASTAQDTGVADGSTVDAEGYLWNAQLVSGELVRYAPDGTVERRIGMPVRNITSLTFGGPGLDEIYVTSMARVKHPGAAAHGHFGAEARPQFAAGAVFRLRGLGIRGLPEPRFAG
jgi:sugar lactone lactonase YvrE